MYDYVCVCTIWTDVKLLMGFHYFAGGQEPMTVCPGQRRPDSMGVKTYLRVFELLLKLLHCVVSNLHGCHNLYCLHQNLPQIFAETISPTVLWFFDMFSPRSCRRRTLGHFGKQSPKHYFGFSTCWSKLYGIWLRLRLTMSDALHRFREVPHVALLFIK